MLPLGDPTRSLLCFILKIYIMFLKMFALLDLLSPLESVLGGFHLCLLSSGGGGFAILVQFSER